MCTFYASDFATYQAHNSCQGRKDRYGASSDLGCGESALHSSRSVKRFVPCRLKVPGKRAGERVLAATILHKTLCKNYFFATIAKLIARSLRHAAFRTPDYEPHLQGYLRL